MLRSPKIIQDARTVEEPEQTIKRGIVQGVLQYSGLPKISNIIHGPGEGGIKGGSKAEVLKVPKEDIGATRFLPGTASYMNTQKKRK